MVGWQFGDAETVVYVTHNHKMEISVPPGTAMILEPGGLDAPETIEQRVQQNPPNQEEREEQQQRENAENQQQQQQNSELAHTVDEHNGQARGEEIKEERNRVIVRRRATRGGGFFARKDGIAPGTATLARQNINGAVQQHNQEEHVEKPQQHDGRKESTNEQQQHQRVAATTTTTHGGLIIRPSYSSIRTGIIKLTPESMKCKLYCRGSKCIYCGAENWPDKDQEIRGIYSNWITDDILAMARPNQRSFEQFDMIGQFKRARIKTVFNLQCVNEHDFCGLPLIAHTGFSYDPELLMREKFFYYNFAIPDFGTASSVHSILNTVKVIWFSLRYGRVAIHCHAGLGRTGTLIACFLIWSKSMSTSEAIDAVRSRRPNSIQSVEQINMVEEFAFHVHKNGTALPSAFYYTSSSSAAGIGAISLRQLMANQHQFLPNEEARQFAHIPKLLYLLGDRLLRHVFGQDGIHYAPPNGHHARSCTFGTVCVNWRNAFTTRGKLQVRQVVNLLARCSAFPYEKDQPLINQYQQTSLVTIDHLITDMDTPQLISLLNAFMESIKKPYCSRRSLIEALGNFSPDNPTGPLPPDSDEEEAAARNGGLGKEDLKLVEQLVNPKGDEEEGEEEEDNEGDGKEQQQQVVEKLEMSEENRQEKSSETRLSADVPGTSTKLDENGIPEKQNIDDALPNSAFRSELMHSKDEPDERVLNQHNDGMEEMNGLEANGEEQDANHKLTTTNSNEERKMTITTIENEAIITYKREVPILLRESGNRPESAFHGAVERHSLTMEKCSERYGGAEKIDEGGEDAERNGGRREEEDATRLEHQQPATTNEIVEETTHNNRPITVLTITSASSMASAVNQMDVSLDSSALIAFDQHDSHTNKVANLNADWQCTVFHVCNVISYLTGENYDSVVDLLTFWFTGDSNRDVKQAIYCHMRDLFARNMRQQEQQAAEWRRRMGLPEKVAKPPVPRRRLSTKKRVEKTGSGTGK